jgi:hypothetical protein
VLNDQELLRYSRQILLHHIDIDGQLRLKDSRVLIVGLGGWVRRWRCIWPRPVSASCIWRISTPST